MKEFINKHPKLYWLIVVVIAIVAFATVTCIGCVKVANAEVVGQTLKVNWKGQEVYVPVGNYPYYLVVKNGSPYGDYVFFSFDKLEFSSATSSVAYYGFGVYDENGMVDRSGDKVKVYGWSGTSDNYADTVAYEWGFSVGTVKPLQENIVANYDVCDKLNGEIVYESIIKYSLDAPYTSFQNATVNYGYEVDDLDDFYHDWMSCNEWKYFGRLNNISAVDLSYSTEPEIVIQLPTVDYVLSMLSANGIEMTADGELSALDMYKVFKCMPDMVHNWYYDKKAPYVEYQFLYSMDLTPDSNGNFTYGFTFLELEYLLRAYNSDLATAFDGYSGDFRAVYMTFAHVRCVTSVVETVRDESILYGKVTTNQFGRGIYNTCVEVIPEVDPETMTKEEMDSIILDATEEAHDKYIKDLENRVEQLEQEMNNTTGSLGGFDTEFEGNGLWDAIKGVGSGLLGMTGFLSSIAGVFGGVFSFMPYDVQQIVGYFLIVSLFIALWKLIKG